MLPPQDPLEPVDFEKLQDQIRSRRTKLEQERSEGASGGRGRGRGGGGDAEAEAADAEAGERWDQQQRQPAGGSRRRAPTAADFDRPKRRSRFDEMVPRRRRDRTARLEQGNPMDSERDRSDAGAEMDRLEQFTRSMRKKVQQDVIVPPQDEEPHQ